MDEYKKAILTRYNEVKEGENSAYLEKPTTAGLKELSLSLINSLSDDDKVIYCRFFKLEKVEFNKVKEFDNDRFRPIISFIKKGTVPRDLNSVELLAILVGLPSRPSKRFKKMQLENQPDPVISGFVAEPTTAYGQEDKVAEQQQENLDATVEVLKEEIITPVADPETGIENVTRDTVAIPQKYFVSPHHRNRYNRIKLIALCLVFFAGTGYAVKSIFYTESECMMWKGDHYEKVPCDLQVNTEAGNRIIPIDENLLAFQRKIMVTDTTTFFNEDRSPRVWYCKSGENEYECFSYPGKHPESNKELKKITTYIIEKYLHK
ncbi:hypothetical protein AM493_01220 [Flavobacterium akiainvivens]|uniref:Uncharacterized protein n=1 Tax=Flavobacterium akiainvivens TaxID=1202724 RepID=A0A0M8M8M6_9FLAO|nr:hypothetical protein [Flavobacterium akiainvivens]KOS04815.1 hypothetical protein AM493_01220 [Flavobacterium akiainvivens]SFQ43759.1 hypothetical protein SAMN05444144_104282 [Flavobacterium akiainvivens]